MLTLPVCLIGAGATALGLGLARAIDFGCRPAGAALLIAGTLLAATPAHADQYKIAADNARVDCTASRRELTRISLVGDQFASISKVSAGGPYNDFSVVNEPVRGDIYLSVPEGYAPSSLSFFGTSKKGYVYKFVCAIATSEAQQLFVTNPGLATAQAAEWENETPLQDSAVRLIRAMAGQATIEGYEVRQPSGPTARVGDLAIRLIAEYRGAALKGKVLRIENKGATPLVLTEADLAPQGTLAVTIADATLAPGGATAAYLVGQNGE